MLSWGRAHGFLIEKTDPARRQDRREAGMTFREMRKVLEDDIERRHGCLLVFAIPVILDLGVPRAETESVRQEVRPRELEDGSARPGEVDAPLRDRSQPSCDENTGEDARSSEESLRPVRTASSSDTPSGNYFRCEGRECDEQDGNEVKYTPTLELWTYRSK